MPELPEVETVKKSLKRKLLHKKIENVVVYYPKIVATPKVEEFIKDLKGEEILDLQRRGKWLVFHLNHYVLLSHLRMEGKYFFRNVTEKQLPHEHVAFFFTDQSTLRYVDTRKFGRMYLLKKEEAEKQKPLCELGKEPFDETLEERYLKNCYQKKQIPIKTVLLDQKIIVGIGNIYADEILFLSHISPKKKASSLTKKERISLIENTKIVLQKAIEKGGTTIRTYTSEEGVHGKFQEELYVHNHENDPCPVCHEKIVKIKLGGRGTYYCPNCQK